MAIYSGFSHSKWCFSIATLNYQRVNMFQQEQPIEFSENLSIQKGNHSPGPFQSFCFIGTTLRHGGKRTAVCKSASSTRPSGFSASTFASAGFVVLDQWWPVEAVTPGFCCYLKWLTVGQHWQDDDKTTSSKDAAQCQTWRVKKDLGLLTHCPALGHHGPWRTKLNNHNPLNSSCPPNLEFLLQLCQTPPQSKKNIADWKALLPPDQNASPVTQGNSL